MRGLRWCSTGFCRISALILQDHNTNPREGNPKGGREKPPGAICAPSPPPWCPLKTKEQSQEWVSASGSPFWDFDGLFCPVLYSFAAHSCWLCVRSAACAGPCARPRGCLGRWACMSALVFMASTLFRNQQGIFGQYLACLHACCTEGMRLCP